MPESIPPARPERSLLSVPASSERFFQKAAESAADTVMLDLEDAVTLDQKDPARLRAVAAVNGVNWGAKTVLVRTAERLSRGADSTAAGTRPGATRT